MCRYVMIKPISVDYPHYTIAHIVAILAGNCLPINFLISPRSPRNVYGLLNEFRGGETQFDVLLHCRTVFRTCGIFSDKGHANQQTKKPCPVVFQK